MIKHNFEVVISESNAECADRHLKDLIFRTRIYIQCNCLTYQRDLRSGRPEEFREF